MEIIISKNKGNTLNKYKIWWRLYAKEAKTATLIYLAAGLIFLLDNVINQNIYEKFWNFNSTIGFALIISAVFYFLNQQRTKYKFLKQIVEAKSQNGQTIITETSISYKDEFTQSETKWSYYTHSKFYKGTLVVMRNNDPSSSILFNNQDMTEENFGILKEFVKINTRRAV
jgi:hypothetical protein